MKYDQHFLVCPETAESIVSAAGLEPGDPVIEIGPGKGVLTERLLKAGARVTAVEIDARLAERLTGRFTGKPLSVVASDWLRLDLDSLPSPAAVVSNLPYSVATPILQRMLDWPGWETAVLMFQKEVADRIRAEPGGRKYGPLSLSVRIKADAFSVCTVPKDRFRPPPKVDSAVVRLERLRGSRLPEDVTEGAFFRVVRAAFAQRRKKAVKSLSAGLALPRERIEGAFQEAGLPHGARAETIGLEGFVSLTRILLP